MNIDLAGTCRHVENHSPVPDAESRLRTSGEFAEPTDRRRVVCELTKRCQDAASNRRVEPGDVPLGSPAVSKSPAAVRASHPCLRSISSWESVRPAARSARLSRTAASSCSVQGSSSSGAFARA